MAPLPRALVVALLCQPRERLRFHGDSAALGAARRSAVRSTRVPGDRGVRSAAAAVCRPLPGRVAASRDDGRAARVLGLPYGGAVLSEQVAAAGRGRSCPGSDPDPSRRRRLVSGATGGAGRGDAGRAGAGGREPHAGAGDQRRIGRGHRGGHAAQLSIQPAVWPAHPARDSGQGGVSTPGRPENGDDGGAYPGSAPLPQHGRLLEQSGAPGDRQDGDAAGSLPRGGRRHTAGRLS